MKKHGMKLFALESGDEVTHFDMLGFTLQYELSYSNIVNMLNAGGFTCGVGEWRVEKDGSFGKYHVETI